MKEIEKALKTAAEAIERAQFQLWPPLAITSCDYSCIAVDGECLPPKPPVKIPAPILAKPVPAQPVPVKPVTTEAVATKTAPVNPVTTEVTATKPIPTKPVPATATASKPEPSKAVATKPTPAKPVPVKPIPAKPVPAKPVKDVEQKKYSVQVRSFKEKELADQHADLLKSKGYNPYVVTFTDPSGIQWFRVRVGKFDNSTDASAFARDLNAKEAEQAIPVEAK
jgi:cell division protein FtsN